MSNIPKIEKVIKRIIIPQHPELTEFEVKDLFEDMYDSGTPLGQQMLGRQYVVVEFLLPYKYHFCCIRLPKIYS